MRHIGSGASGDVFEAVDREQGTRVAVKVLRVAQPHAIARFKREFRALQDLHHPNLISFGELFEEARHLFFTMELVEGERFVDHVRPCATVGVAYEDTKLLASSSGSSSGRAAAPSRHRHDGVLDEARLRSGLTGLSQGLRALHAAGKVHRDIKPSNVIVGRDGRVVVLDLGLLIDLDDADSWSSGGVVGTPQYMAPEQAIGAEAGPAADWYSVGVMLYESLTGMLPFDGPALKVLQDKQRDPPPRPRDRVPDLPPDLDDLCARLLRFDPDRRPTGDDILRVVDRSIPGRVQPPIAITASGAPPFVGRAAELATLSECCRAAASEQRPVVALVSGPSGLGKTMLVDQFARSQDPETAILSGRCYERESVPFKAFDGIISSLARLLCRADPVEAASLLPLHASPLAQVFPALKRVKVFAEAPHEVGNGYGHQQLRARVFGALRELLTRLAQRRPVVLTVDDLQWADNDSFLLMTELLRGPDAPPVVVIGTMRSTASSTADEIGARLRATGADVRELELAPLSDGESRRLAELLIEAHGVSTAVDTEALTCEAGGHPLFLDELVRHAAHHGGNPAVVPQLDDALWRRVEALEPDARRIIEVVALAGNPLYQETIGRAAETAPSQFGRLVSTLRVSNLVRTSGARGSDTIEPYHDRVREAIAKQLDPERRTSIHRDLAVALEGSPHPGQEPMLAFHWQQAGQTARAALYAAAAGDSASASLAFDRAADFYRRALDLGHTDEVRLTTALGNALSDAGRGADAAAAYQRAAAATGVEADALDLQRRAAEQLLISGHIQQGLEMIATVLKALGMRLPKTSVGALASLLWRRALLRMRGLRFRERQGSAVAATELMRIDLCFSLATGLANVDTIRGADFQTRHLLLALRAGEPTRLARAIAIEGGFASTANRSTRRRSRRLFDTAHALLERNPWPEGSAMLIGAECVGAYQSGLWRRALELAEEGERALQQQRTHLAWVRDTIQFFHLYSLFYLGELRTLARRAPDLLRAAAEHGDLYAATNLRNGLCNAAWLVRDDLEQAHRNLDDSERQWNHEGYHVQHYHYLLGRVNAHLYAGDAERASEIIAQQWRALERSLLLRVEAVRIEAVHMRGRVALALAEGETGAARRRLLRRARGCARALVRSREPWANGLGHLLAGGERSLRGDDRAAQMQLQRAHRSFTEADMAAFALAAAHRRGELLSGDEGSSLGAEARAALRRQGVVRPDRFIAMLAPGFDGAPPDASLAAPQTEQHPRPAP